MVEINGVRTHYQRMPAKQTSSATPPTVVFVHGLGYDSLASFYLTLAAPVASAGIDALTYDLRAHGRSDRPATGYRVGDFVEDLSELLRMLGIDRPVHVVGNSFGGTIAFSFAARYPERVASIVSIESEPATRLWADRMDRTLVNVIDEMDAEANLAWIAETFGSHHARLAKIAGMIIRATSIVQDIPQGPWLGADDLSAITCPVLSIVGSEGFQRNDLMALQAALPNCRTEVIAGQNHSVLVERHHTVRELVLDWVGLHDLASSESAGAA
ncbi:MAG: alpha/beta fold hydrolase [Haloechinothrix sp.]